MNEVSSDISQPLKITARRGDTFDMMFNVYNADGTDYNFTDHVVNVDVYTSAADRSPNLSFANGSGLTISGNSIMLQKSVSEMNPLRRGDRIYFLRVTFPDGTKKTWLQGPFIVNEGVSGGSDDSTASLTINGSGDVVEITVSGSVNDSEIPIVAFATELTFNVDKDLQTVTGGTRTFTLAADGHKNGVGIIARVNTPTAINFPVSFEALAGSDSVSTTGMNLILFRYFSDYDGAGNAKVLYTIKNQTAL